MKCADIIDGVLESTFEIMSHLNPLIDLEFDATGPILSREARRVLPGVREERAGGRTTCSRLQERRQKFHMEAETALTDRRVRQCAPRCRTRVFFETTEGDTNDFDDALDDSGDADNDRDLSRQESIMDFTETTGTTSTRMADVVRR